MAQLVINGKKQSVTTMVTYYDMDGQQHILLARPDPRYPDKTGQCLEGTKLSVGPCQFIGGQVEEDVQIDRLTSLETQQKGFNVLPDSIDRRIAAAAITEVAEESSLDVSKHITDQTHLSLVETLTRQSRQSGKSQDIHYLNLDLGFLSPDQMEALHGDLAPADDMIQLIDIPTTAIQRDGSEISIALQEADIKTKESFSGFPEIDHWNAEYEATIGKATQDGNNELAERLQSQRNTYNRINTEITGLQGVDEASLAPKMVGMFKPRTAGIRTDDEILTDFLKSPSIPRGATIILATRNPGKVDTFRELLKNYDVTVISEDDLEGKKYLNRKISEPPEDGHTFEENAAIGVRAVQQVIQASDLPNKDKYWILSDDSGMIVKGMTWQGGLDPAGTSSDELRLAKAEGKDARMVGFPFPGLHTKRFREAQEGTKEEQYEKAFAYYDRIANEAGHDRAASDVSVLGLTQATAPIEKVPTFFRGEVKGSIAYPPRGNGGFGYDKILEVEGTDKTLAEHADAGTKEQYNSRENALRILGAEVLESVSRSAGRGR